MKYKEQAKPAEAVEIRMVISPDWGLGGWSVSRMELGTSGVLLTHLTKVPVAQVSSVYANASSCKHLVGAL